MFFAYSNKSRRKQALTSEFAPPANYVTRSKLSPANTRTALPRSTWWWNSLRCDLSSPSRDCAITSSLCAISKTANRLFACWLRSRCTLTEMPLATCVARMPESVLLTYPPHDSCLLKPRKCAFEQSHRPPSKSDPSQSGRQTPTKGEYLFYCPFL